MTYQSLKLLYRRLTNGLLFFLLFVTNCIKTLQKSNKIMLISRFSTISKMGTMPKFTTLGTWCPIKIPTLGIYYVTVKFPWVARPPLGLDIDRCINLWLRTSSNNKFVQRYLFLSIDTLFIVQKTACKKIPVNIKILMDTLVDITGRTVST